MSIREPSQFDPLLQRLLRYFAQQSLQLQSHQQSPPPILHPDRSINRLINSPELPESSFRHAAVLIPIACGESSNSIIFTLRTEHLSSHAGQVSFPGGTQDSDDDSIEHTALRECEEEIGLRSESVRIIGRLGNLLMPSGYCVTPVVGLFAAGTPCMVATVEVFGVASCWQHGAPAGPAETAEEATAAEGGEDKDGAEGTAAAAAVVRSEFLQELHITE